MADVRVRADNDTHRYLVREAERTGIPVAQIALAFLAEATRRQWHVPGGLRVDTEQENSDG